MASEWVKIFFALCNCNMEIGFTPDIGWRQINESSSKRDSVEFFATYRDECKSKHPRITIDMVVFVSPSQKR